MPPHKQLSWVVVSLLGIVLLHCLPGCETVPSKPRIDNLPMYGQPDIQRPDFLKKADEDFVRSASNAFGGSRTDASKAWAAEAETFLQKGNLDYAMRRYNQAWLLDPENYKAYWGFGRIALEKDQFDPAIGFFEKAIRLCHDTTQMPALLSDAATGYSFKAAYLPQAQTQERARFFAKANETFDRSTKLSPKRIAGWRRWALSLFREGDYTVSMEKAEVALSLDENAFAQFPQFLDTLREKLAGTKSANASNSRKWNNLSTESGSNASSVRRPRDV